MTDIDQLFTRARTANAFLPQPIEPALLHRLYHLMSLGPTSANCSPARLVFVQSAAAKERLLACLSKGNQGKTRQAPVTAIIGMDMRFYEQLPRLFPHADARAWFTGNDTLIRETALRNASLQGAYLMVAARALGLDCGPMSGFDAARVDAEFGAVPPSRPTSFAIWATLTTAPRRRACHACRSTKPAGSSDFTHKKET